MLARTLTLLGLSLSLGFGYDSEMAAKGRELASEHSKAIITVLGTVERRGQEQTINLPATLVHRKGLAVTSHAVANGGDLKDLKFILGNGEEIPAKVSFEDPEIDLLFLEAAGSSDDPASLEPIPLSEEEVEAAMFDPVISFVRQPVTLDRQIAINYARVRSILPEPRKQYILTNTNIGSPVFCKSGELLGITVYCKRNGRNLTPAVLPSLVVSKIVKELEAQQAASGGNQKEVWKEVQENYQEAVVFYEAISQDGDRERESSGLATVLDESGLAVTPYGYFRGDLKEIRMVLGDGTEIPAEMVYIDRDLDLAFLQPDAETVKEEEIRFTPVKFPGDQVRLEMGDPVVILSRESASLRRRPSVLLTNVITVIESPRRIYRTPVRPPGSPAFHEDGRWVGVYVRRMVNGRAIHRIIMPAETILKAAEEAKGEKEESKEEKEDESEEENDAPADTVDFDDEGIN